MKHLSSFGKGLILLGVLACSYFLGYTMMHDEYPHDEPQIAQIANLIEPYQFSFWESYALCEEYNLGCQPQRLAMEMPADFLQLNIDDIRALYPLPQWLIIEDGNDISITHLLEGLCAEHKKILHLGVNQSGEYLTICYGPSKVSSLGGIYLVSDIPLAGLTAAEQDKILHGYYESSSYEELQGILDSFSETN